MSAQIPLRDGATRVMVVASVRLYRDGLVLALHRGAFHVVPCVCHVDAVRATIATTRPQVSVIDVGSSDAFAVIRDIRENAPESRVIAFAVEDSVSQILQCADAGASAFVTSDASSDDLIAIIERAAVGELVCSAMIAGFTLS